MLRNRFLKLGVAVGLLLLVANVATAQSMKEAGPLYNAAMKNYKAKQHLDKVVEDILKCIEMCNEIDSEQSDALKSSAQQVLPKVYVDYAKVVYKQGKVDESLVIMEKAMEAAVEIGDRKMERNLVAILSRIYFNEGLARKAKGDYQAAVTLFDKSIMVNPKQMNAILGKAICLDSLRLYPEMLKTLQDGMLKARQCSDPKSEMDMRVMASNHLKIRAHDFKEKKNLDSAIAYFARATEVDKRDANLYLAMATCYSDMKDHLQVVDNAKLALEYAPATMDKAQIYYLMAQALQAQGNVEGACAAYKQAAQGMDYKKTSEYQIKNVLKCK